MTPLVDLSHWQDRKSDYPLLAQHVDGAWFRIAYGLTADTAFAREWDLARALRRRGVYQYIRAGIGARVQAEFCVDLLSLAGMFELPPAIDVEEGAPSVEDIETWLSVVELSTGVTPAIYGSSSFLAGLRLPASFATYPLWLADYRARPVVPAPWTVWSWWQWTGSGSVPGVTGAVDRTWEAG